MPSPTAASAAATTITKKTNTWPCSCPYARPNATNARFTALSISSMDMNTVMMFRRTRKPTTPSPKRIALSARKYEIGTTSSLLQTLADACAARPLILSLRQHHRPEDGDQDQNRSQFERENKILEQQQRQPPRRTFGHGLSRKRR